jgi:hypothetical protein
MKWLTFLNDKEEIIHVEVEKEFEVPKIQVEVTFVGKRNEAVTYKEFHEPFITSYGDFESDPYKLLMEYVAGLEAGRYAFYLEHNSKVLHKEYYQLAEATLKGTRVVNKKAKILEQKVVKKY